MAEGGRRAVARPSPPALFGYNPPVDLLPILVPVALVPVIIVIVVLLRRGQQKRNEDLRAAAGAMGFVFEDHRSVDDIAARGALPLFGHGHTKRASNVMTGRAGGQEVMLFDYQYTTGSGKESNTHRQTVALFPRVAERLPDLVLAPENVLHKIGQVFGYQDIDFDSNPAFSSRYLLRGADDYAIRAAFSPDALSFFEQQPGWHVEIKGGTAGIYRAGKRAKPENIATFLEETCAILRALGCRI